MPDILSALRTITNVAEGVYLPWQVYIKDFVHRYRRAI